MKLILVAKTGQPVKKRGNGYLFVIDSVNHINTALKKLQLTYLPNTTNQIIFDYGKENSTLYSRRCQVIS